MKMRKNILFGIALILTLFLTTSCEISITRNQYYGQMEKSRKIKQNETGSTYVADTLKHWNNGQNR